MANEQPQTDYEASRDARRSHETLSDAQGWKTVSTFDVLELSEDEMERVAGVRAISINFSKIEV